MADRTAATNGRTVPHVNGKASYAEKHQIADHFIGGNKLETAPSSKVKDFVASHDGHTVITNVSFCSSSWLERDAFEDSGGMLADIVFLLLNRF